MIRITQLGLDVAGISLDREARGEALADAGAELDECERLAKCLSVEELDAIHRRVRASRAAMLPEGEGGR